ncbi:BRICHOS domain-containing protein 5 [Brachionichthys hirsutus]|uniref:BRICHOS domain-containing protein 5 n=1 Tax=Brachionichthys hirsutus TaxID=412623 RepID=UPI0036054727
MLRCWKRSAGRVEEAQCSGGSDASSQFRFPHKALWVSLPTSLLLVIVALALTGHLGPLGPLKPPSQSSQIVRITAPDLDGLLINQSVVVDRQNDLVTFSLISPENKTSTVLFDIKHELICYKPVEQDSCFLRPMGRSDYDNVHALLHEQQRSHVHLSGNETQRLTEFLGVLAATQVDLSTPVQALCRDKSVHWTRRSEGPGKQRLVYFCIDICFPSNVCVSVCFYYLPE